MDGAPIDNGVHHPAGQHIQGLDVTASEPAREARPWLGIRFLCSGAYVRVYRNAAGNAYCAACPRCGKQVRFAVGAGGTNRRFFEVRC